MPIVERSLPEKRMSAPRRRAAAHCIRNGKLPKQAAANAGNREGQFMLGLYCITRQPENTQRRGIGMLKAASVGGMPEANYWLGVVYLDGLGVPKNITEAAKWFRLAADQGNAEALRFHGHDVGFGGRRVRRFVREIDSIPPVGLARVTRR